MLMAVNKILGQATNLIGNSTVPSGFVAPGSAAERIAGFFNLFIILCTIIATFFFIRGGLDYIMSAGEPAKVKAGMAAIQYSIIGLIVCGVAFMVLGIVKNVLGIDNTDLGL